MQFRILILIWLFRKILILMGNYDIIGDIHGYADTLSALLAKLGYGLNKHGFYSHPERKIIFVGDFIDRGKGQKKVINIVRSMIDNGSALAVMGNHEFNAIAYHTKHSKTGLPLRSHSDAHKLQHQAFLNEYTDKDERTEIINWFKSLPLFLELEEIRVIHACWNSELINSIKVELNNKNCLTDNFLEQANHYNSRQFNAVETLLKGKEIPLPENTAFKDNYGIARHNIRIKWWSDTAQSYYDYALVPGDAIKDIPRIPLPQELIQGFYYPDNEVPVFFGHYWFRGQPKIQKKNVAGVDYSIGKGDKLVAYRWSTGDIELSDKNFVINNVI